MLCKLNCIIKLTCFTPESEPCKKTAVTIYIIIVTAVFYYKSVFDAGTLHRTCGMFAE